MPVVILLGFVTLLGLKYLAPQSLPAQDHATLGISPAREGQLPGAEQELREAVRAAPGMR
jgi:Flp pilus assembly protein TadD